MLKCINLLVLINSLFFVFEFLSIFNNINLILMIVSFFSFFYLYNLSSKLFNNFFFNAIYSFVYKKLYVLALLREILNKLGYNNIGKFNMFYKFFLIYNMYFLLFRKFYFVIYKVYKVLGHIFYRNLFGYLIVFYLELLLRFEISINKKYFNNSNLHRQKMFYPVDFFFKGYFFD